MANVDKSERRAAPQPVDWLVCILIGMAPALFALATWSSQHPPYAGQGFIRSFSIPITAIEIVVVGFAIFVGSGPFRAIARMSLSAQLLLGLLVAIALITAVTVAVNRPTALMRTNAWLIHLLFGFSVWRLLANRWSELRHVVWPAAVVGVVLYTVVLVVLLLAIPNELAFDWRRFGLGVTHIRQVGFYSLVGGAAAIGLAAVARSARGYWLMVGSASACLAVSYWSGTRGSLIALVVAFVAGLVLLPAMRTLRAVGALLCANAVGALISLVHQPPHAFYGILRISKSSAAGSADALASGRLTQWSASAEAVLQRPLFGFGESQYGVAVPDWGQFNHPHNIILQAAISWGLVGLACFAALGLYVVWKFIPAARAGGGEAVPAFLVAAALATMSLYEGSLYHPYPVMMVTLALAFVLSSPPQSQLPSLETHPSTAA